MSDSTEQEILFKEFTKITQEVFWHMSPSLDTVYYINPSFQTIWHRSCEELKLNPSLLFDEIVEKDREIVRKAFLQDADASAVFQIRRPDGTLRKIYSRCYPQKDATGKITSKMGFAVDITEYEKSKQRSALEDDIIKTLSLAKSFNIASAKILEIICSALDCQVGEIWMVNKQQCSMSCLGNWYTQTALGKTLNKRLDLTILPGKDLPGQIWQKNAPQWLNASPSLELSTFHTAFGVPIRSEQEFMGVLVFFSEEKLLEDEQLLHVLDGIGRELGQFITQLYSRDQLSYLLQHDGITNFFNRYTFRETLKELIQNKGPNFLPVLMFRVDRFDFLLESVGHEVCDDLLQLIANKIRHNLLHLDDLPARIKLDTFAIALTSVKTIDQVNYFIARLSSLFSVPLMIKNKELFITISVGASIYPQHGSTMEELLANAGTALQKAEEHGGNSFTFFSGKEQGFAVNKLELESQLRKALLEKQFKLYYQPQFNMANKTIVGCESLIRWQNPERGLLAPLEFLPTLEKTDLIANVGEWVLREVCQQITRMEIPIAVNLSIYQFRPQYNLISFLKNLLKETGVNPEHLNLEITESLLIPDIAGHFETLEGLKNLSVRLSLTDFGTGYSSLNYLQHFPVSKVKIEKSFIDGLPGDRNSKAIIAAIIALAHGLGFTVLAEGVETHEQFEFLKQAGCDEIQGYYLAKPMPILELEQFIEQSS